MQTNFSIVLGRGRYPFGFVGLQIGLAHGTTGIDGSTRNGIGKFTLIEGFAVAFGNKLQRARQIRAPEPLPRRRRRQKMLAERFKFLVVGSQSLPVMSALRPNQEPLARIVDCRLKQIGKRQLTVSF